MKIYLLSAAGVIFLSVMVSLLIPEGKLNKSITFIMRLLCISVLIQPVTTIFKLQDTDTVDYTDYEYITAVYSNHQSRQLEKLLNEKLEVDTECLVEVEYSEDKFKSAGVTVKLFCGENNSAKKIDEIYEYLQKLGYINITVYAESN